MGVAGGRKNKRRKNGKIGRTGKGKEEEAKWVQVASKQAGSHTAL